MWLDLAIWKWWAENLAHTKTIQKFPFYGQPLARPAFSAASIKIYNRFTSKIKISIIYSTQCHKSLYPKVQEGHSFHENLHLMQLKWSNPYIFPNSFKTRTCSEDRSLCIFFKILITCQLSPICQIMLQNYLYAESFWNSSWTCLHSFTQSNVKTTASTHIYCSLFPPLLSFTNK